MSFVRRVSLIPTERKPSLPLYTEALMFNSIGRGSFLCLSIILAITCSGSAQIQSYELTANSRSKTQNLFNVAELKRGCCSASSNETSAVRLNNLAYESYTLAATYYSLNENLTSTLMLNNKGPQPIEATPTFYSLAGTRLRLAPIVVPAASYLDIDLHQLLAGAGEEFREGSVKIAYQGGDYQLGAQVKLIDAQRSLIWEEQLVYPSKFVSNRLESVWWLPVEDMTTRLVVSNTKYSAVTVTLKVDGTSPGQTAPVQIQLNPSQTRVLDVMRDLIGNENGSLQAKGGISITHTGSPGAVLAKMMIAKPTQGFSSTMRFIDPESTASQKWHGNGLRLRHVNGSQLQSLLVARNTTDQVSRIHGKIPYTRPNGAMAAVNIPITQIAPHSTKIVNLQNLIDSANVPGSVRYAGIELEYDTPKGSVVTSVLSVSQNGNHVFQVPIFDPMKTPSSAGGYPWKADGDYVTLLYVKNETDQPKKYTAFLVFDGGSYSLGVSEIKANQTVAVDFKHIRDEQIPDRNGSIIPLTAVKGQIAWSVSGVENKVLSGRSEQISLSRGVASTYDCRNCCPNSVYDAWLDPFSVYENIGSTTGFLANQRDISCNGQIYGPYTPTSQTWNSTDWNIASVNGYGMETGVGVGMANIQSSWEAVTWWDWGSEACDPTAVPVMAEAPVEVIPNLTINVPPSAIDGSSASFSATLVGTTATGFYWSFESPSGAGNNPQVNFSVQNEASTTAVAHWFALPNSPCATSPPPASATHPYFNSKYKIKVTVSHSGGETTAEADFSVNAFWEPGGKVDPATNSGGPLVNFNSQQNLWVVVGPGTLQRNTNAPVIFIPNSSQFYNKILTHEEKHEDQWNSGMLVNIRSVSSLMQAISTLTDTTAAGLSQKINQAVTNWDSQQVQNYLSLRDAAEIEAYGISDPIAPLFAYQVCGRTTFP